ncbi:MAG: septum formation initiator family protein [Gemmatimonadaceae bacterium]|nr:septum formation initiator family protein [Gemmatimonadaceae bacterium]
MTRLLGIGALVAAIYFAVQGGEFSTVDLWRQRARETLLRRAIDSLRHDIDSLTTLRRQLQSDPVVQERVAREVYGMVRGDKELLYRFVDTTRSKP